MNTLRQLFNVTWIRTYSYKYPYNPLMEKYKERTKLPDDCDAPIMLEKNPYDKTARKCILCEHKIDLDYKNTRLLQQFVSSFSGRVYSRHITGLCTKQDRKLNHVIATSRKAGLMPIFVKDPKYLRDPRLFNPMKPLRSHNFA